jgi:copper resistance protein C
VIDPLLASQRVEVPQPGNGERHAEAAPCLVETDDAGGKGRQDEHPQPVRGTDGDEDGRESDGRGDAEEAGPAASSDFGRADVAGTRPVALAVLEVLDRHGVGAPMLNDEGPLPASSFHSWPMVGRMAPGCRVGQYTCSMHAALLRVATTFAIIALLILPASVLADADLDVATPADGATVEGIPSSIEATFTQALDAEGSTLRLRDAADVLMAEGGVDADDDQRMVIDPVPALAPGTYVVRWTTLSKDDTHVQRGTWSFTVTAEPSPEPTPSAVVTDPPTTDPSVEPTLAPTTGPSPSPSGDEDPAASEGDDVLLPIIAALAIVAIAGAVLLSRRGRATGA